ncbi:hypothetical protein [Streptomyces sp. ADI95-17]|uniref:hypothetical protein n=1 Tax=Streptomyces sp. ADI95-17 TaxID=1522759 RepID=UPI000F5BB0EA|nr:hypothetical protein [Streptomyces sp. ADI95-17]RPK74506.1 hypothetical protein EES42_08550 [Streptomyces sp. ADI95-17]
MAAEKDAPAPGGRAQLRNLVRERKAALGLSFDKLAQRCIDPETGEQTIKASWLHRLATDLPVQAPDLPQLRALAVGLQVPLYRVQDAAGAEFFGIDTEWSASGDARAFLEGADRLTAEQREQIRRLMDTMAPPE